jgi:hypothetical protein
MHHEEMPRLHGPDVHEGDDHVVLMEKGRRRIASDDGAEDALRRLRFGRWHRRSIVPIPLRSTVDAFEAPLPEFLAAGLRGER